jgi:hypothetical protein
MALNFSCGLVHLSIGLKARIADQTANPIFDFSGFTRREQRLI